MVPCMTKPLGLAHSVLPLFMSMPRTEATHGESLLNVTNTCTQVEKSLLGRADDLTMHRSHLGILFN